MIQLFSIRMIRPVGFGYKDGNHIFVLLRKTTGGNMHRYSARILIRTNIMVTTMGQVYTLESAGLNNCTSCPSTGYGWQQYNLD